MQNLITVRYKAGGKNYDFDPAEFRPKVGDHVIVDTSRGEEYATVTRSLRMVDPEMVRQPLRSLVRMATAEDDARVKQLREKEKRAASIAREKVAEHKLDMKIVDVQYPFQGEKVLVLFTSEGRVDFRALVRDLASMLKARIELRQIGVRDETRILGGIATCGKVFCCNEFLNDFHPVSIKMAKTQGLSLNPTKISGACGRLMCCLKYEQTAYEDASKRMPKDGSYVETPDGTGTIHGVNMLRETVKVRLDQSTEAPKHYYTDELLVVRHGKGKIPEDYVPSTKAEMEKRRRAPVVREEDAPFASSLGTRISGLEIFDEPKQRPEKRESSRPRNRQSRGQKKDGKPQQAKPQQPKQAKPQQPKQPKPQPPKPKQPKPQAEGQPQGQSRNRRRKPKPQNPQNQGGGKKES